MSVRKFKMICCRCEAEMESLRHTAAMLFDRLDRECLEKAFVTENKLIIK